MLATNHVNFGVRRGGVGAPLLTKSLLTRSRRGSAIAIAICACQEKVDLCAIARLLGWHAARLASPLEILALLGPDQQEISPVVQVDGLPVLIDAALADAASAGSDRLLVNAGTHELYLEMSLNELIRLTRGTCARVALPRSRWQ